MSTQLKAATRPVWKRCWCWQWGRCLTLPCPTANVPPPQPMTNENLRLAYRQVCAARGIQLSEPCETCDGDGCEEGCGYCNRAHVGPDSHRVCRTCDGTGRRSTDEDIP